MATEEPTSAAAKFWPRVGAFVVDGLVLGIAAVLLGLLAFDLLARLGEVSRLIGLAAATLYFGLMNGPLGGGQTLGQRLLKLKVATIDGGPLPAGRALLRALILVAPVVANGISLRATGPTGANLAIALLGGVLVFGVGLAQIYLLIFNRPSRRMVHDLLTGAAVIRVDSAASVPTTRPVHIYVAAGIVAAVAAGACALSAYGLSQTQGVFAELRAPLAGVEALPEVESATVLQSTTTMTLSSGTRTTHALVVNARLNTWPTDRNIEAQRIAAAALRIHRLPPDQSLMVTLRYGFDLGIGSSWRSYSATIHH